MQRFPAGIQTLGFVSLLMDISSEMIHALLPSYLVTVLGAPMLEVGIVGGITEATASITKLVSYLPRPIMALRLGKSQQFATKLGGIAPSGRCADGIIIWVEIS